MRTTENLIVCWEVEPVPEYNPYFNQLQRLALENALEVATDCPEIEFQQLSNETRDYLNTGISQDVAAAAPNLVTRIARDSAGRVAAMIHEPDAFNFPVNTPRIYHHQSTVARIELDEKRQHELKRINPCLFYYWYYFINGRKRHSDFISPNQRWHLEQALIKHQKGNRSYLRSRKRMLMGIIRFLNGKEYPLY